MQIEFDFQTEGDELPDAYFDAFELDVMFQHTRESIRKTLEHKLTGVVCDQHGEAPRFTITATYNHETEQMDLAYNIDTCCKLFLVRVTKILNRQA